MRISCLPIVLMTVPLGVTAQDFQSSDFHIEPLAQGGRFPATLELAQTARTEAEVQTLGSDATGAGYPAHGQHQEHALKGKKMGQGAVAAQRRRGKTLRCSSSQSFTARWAMRRRLST